MLTLSETPLEKGLRTVRQELAEHLLGEQKRVTLFGGFPEGGCEVDDALKFLWAGAFPPQVEDLRVASRAADGVVRRQLGLLAVVRLGLLDPLQTRGRPAMIPRLV